MNILAFFAHPDDETMLIGGTLALLAGLGAHVHYLCATRGEGGEVGDPALCERSRLGEVREQELVCAVRVLRGRSLTFLDYIDPTVGPDNALYPYTDNLTMLAGQVAASIRQFEIDVVITHGSNGEYGHPAHVLTHQAAQLAARSFADQSKFKPRLYTVAAAYPGHPRPRLANASDKAHLVLDVRPTLVEKTSAALCHATQHALFVRRPSAEAGRRLSVPEVILSEESLHRAYPAVKGRPEDSLVRLLRGYRKTRQQDDA